MLAATNRADVLDAALMRPGRFDVQLHVPLPDTASREAILQVHTRSMPLDATVNLEVSDATGQIDLSQASTMLQRGCL